MSFSSPDQEIDQSDVFKAVYFYSIDKSYPAVLVTPICDVKHQKADYLSFCGILDFSYLLMKILENNQEILRILKDYSSKTALPTTKRERLERFIGQLKSNFHYPRYHWLNTFPGEDSVKLIDFQLSASLTLEETMKLERILSIKSPCREQIPVRYSTYMARIGVPDLTSAEDVRVIEISIDTLFSIRDKLDYSILNK